MISPRSASIDYGSLLAPPADYSVDFALGTTYSLDLHALVCSCLSLGLSVDVDSVLAEDELYLFSALAEMKGKLAVMCEKGRIQGAKDYSRLYCMVEEAIVEVDLDPGGRTYPSFHPKTWIVRFAPDDGSGPVCYRICVLSRNLTFDSSWDVAGCFDGEYREGHSSASRGGRDLSAYLVSLLKHCRTKAHEGKIKQMISEIPYVNFGAKSAESLTGCRLVLPFSFTGVEGARSFSDEFALRLDRAERVLVMSPFISASPGAGDPLARIANTFEGSRERPLLVTRKASLAKAAQDAVLAEKLRTFSLFALRDDLIAAQFENEANGGSEDSGEPGLGHRDIHAKLYLFEGADGVCDLYFGSANASRRGLALNQEAMAHLRTEEGVTFDSIIGELGLTAAEIEKGSLFEPVPAGVFPSLSMTAFDAQREARERDFDHFLRRVRLFMEIDLPKADVDSYTVKVSAAKCDGFEASGYRIGLASESCERAFEKEVRFENVRHRDLTTFVRVVCASDGFQISRLLRCEVRRGREFLEERDVEVFREVVRGRFNDYLAFRLSDNPEREGMAGRGPAAGSAGQRTGYAVRPRGVYEELLESYAKKWEQADAFVGESIALLESDKGIAGADDADDLIALLETVRKGARHGRR